MSSNHSLISNICRKKSSCSRFYNIKEDNKMIYDTIIISIFIITYFHISVASVFTLTAKYNIAREVMSLAVEKDNFYVSKAEIYFLSRFP